MENLQVDFINLWRMLKENVEINNILATMGSELGQFIE